MVSNEETDFDFVDLLLIERSDTRDVDRWRQSIEEYSDELDEHDNYLRRFQLVLQIESIPMDHCQVHERSAEIRVNEIDSMECFYKKDNDCFFLRGILSREFTVEIFVIVIVVIVVVVDVVVVPVWWHFLYVLTNDL